MSNESVEKPTGQQAAEKVSPPTREAVVRQVLEEGWEWNGKGLDELPGLAKWMLRLNSDRGEPYVEEVTRQRLLGLFRGFMGERVSGALRRLDQADTVFSTVSFGDLDSLEVIDPFDVPGGPNKHWILSEAVRAGLGDFAPVEPEDPTDAELDAFEDVLRQYLLDTTNLTGDELEWYVTNDGSATWEEAVEVMKEDIILGYGAPGFKASKKKGLEESDPGILHFGSTMPDAFAPNMEGFVEVKAIKPFELAVWVKALHVRETPDPDLTEFVTDDALKEAGGEFYPHPEGGINLGLDTLAEVQLVDDVCAGHDNANPLGRDALIILRFPSDAADEDLEELGRIIHDDLYFSRVVIQRLPFSSEEITDLALKAVASQKELFFRPPSGTKGRPGMTFKDREIALIGSVVGEDWRQNEE